MTKPNILYIHSHDTGRFIEPYGAPFHTPNFMALAKKGATFRQAFCVASSCSAARSAFLTGMYPHQNGMTGLGHRGWRLYDYQKTMVSVLKGAGYHTVLMGESHITPRAQPELIGYDEVLIGDTSETIEITREAVPWLENAPDQPWFLSCGFWDTHRTSYPQPTKEHTDYGGVMPVFPATPELRADFAAFRGSVERLDGGIGDVLRALEKSGQADNTIVVATTDHAPGFPLYKANVSDKGLGVFMLMSGPGVVPGTVYEPIVTHMDVFPTLCDMIGIDQPEWLEGVSLQSVLRGETAAPVHEAVFGESNYHAAYEPQRSVRTEKYRYFERYDGRTTPVLPNIDDSPSKTFWLSTQPVLPQKSLFDITADPLERVNLAGDPQYADVEAELAGQLHDWREASKDPLLLEGAIPFPIGALANNPDDTSAEVPTHPLTNE